MNLLVIALVAIFPSFACGHYMPVAYDNDEPSCSCSAGSQSDVPTVISTLCRVERPHQYGYRIDKPTRREEEAPSDVRYTFNFDVQQPREAPSSRLKSYGIALRKPPPKEIPQEDIRYTYDYKLQVPSDSMLNDVPRCHECVWGGESPMFSGRQRRSIDENDVGVDSDVERVRRQSPKTSGPSEKRDAITRIDAGKKKLEVRMEKSKSRRIDGRQRREEIVGAAQQQIEKVRTAAAERLSGGRKIREEIVGATQKRRDEILASVASRVEPIVGAPQQRRETYRSRFDESYQRRRQLLDDIRARIQSRTANIFQQNNNLVNNFGNTIQAPTEVRQKRGTSSNEIDQTLSPLSQGMPSAACPTCSTMQSLKEKSVEDHRLRSPEAVQFMPELQLDTDYDDYDDDEEKPDSTKKYSRQCESFGRHAEPQYFEYVGGKRMPYELGSTHEHDSKSPEPAAPRFVYDRLGHTYMENDGNLRLMTPRDVDEVGQSPTEFISGVLNENSEVLDELNPVYDEPGRMLPPVSTLVKDAVEYLHDIARRDVGSHRRAPSARSQPKASSVQTQQEFASKHNETDAALSREDDTEPDVKTKRMYQVLPFEHDDRDGSVIVKIFSDNKPDTADKSKTSPATRGEDKIVREPTFETVKNGDKEYDILTVYEDPDADSQEEIHSIVRHLKESREKAQSANP